MYMCELILSCIFSSIILTAHVLCDYLCQIHLNSFLLVILCAFLMIYHKYVELHVCLAAYMCAFYPVVGITL